MALPPFIEKSKNKREDIKIILKMMFKGLQLGSIIKKTLANQ